VFIIPSPVAEAGAGRCCREASFRKQSKARGYPLALLPTSGIALSVHVRAMIVAALKAEEAQQARQTEKAPFAFVSIIIIAIVGGGAGCGCSCVIRTLRPCRCACAKKQGHGQYSKCLYCVFHTFLILVVSL
jgi:hypothetical protein